MPDDHFADSNCDGIDGDKNVAVFVSPDGTDGGAGTIDAPLRTLNAAIQTAASAARDVYVCNGTYAENVVIEKVSVRIFAGFDCSQNWARSAARAVVAPTSGRPLLVSQSSSVFTNNLDFKAPAASKPGDSSIAVIVQDSTLEIIAATIEAANGAPGIGGPVPAPAAPSPYVGADGASAAATFCGRAGDITITCDQLKGGARSAVVTMSCGGEQVRFLPGFGGDGSTPFVGDASTSGTAGLPGLAPGGRYIQPSNPALPGTRTEAEPGRAGTVGAAGSSSVKDFGEIRNGEYAPSNSGTDGKRGGAGNSGGGGAGGASYLESSFTRWYAGGGGGEGGAPGCGGTPGSGGGGGGASIAVLIISSDVQLRQTDVRTGAGGVGGKPSAGAKGQPGGPPGKGGKGVPFPPGVDGNSDGNPGGRGGDGGDGGPGGAGSGGPSVGLVIVGKLPATENVTFNVGKGGPPGQQLAGAPAKTGLSAERYTYEAP